MRLVATRIGNNNTADTGTWEVEQRLVPVPQCSNSGYHYIQINTNMWILLNTVTIEVTETNTYTLKQFELYELHKRSDQNSEW